MRWIIIGVLIAFGIWLGEGLIEVIKNMFSIGKPYIIFVLKHYGFVCLVAFIDVSWLIILFSESGPLRTEEKLKGLGKWVWTPLAYLFFGGGIFIMNWIAYEDIQKAPEYIPL